MNTFTTLHQFSDWGLLALRIALGAIFIVHGWPKVTDPKRGEAAGFSSGFWLLIGLGETLGGLTVLLGFLTQIGAAIIAVVMLGAHYYKIVVWKAPFADTQKLGWEFDFILLASALALFFLGAGSIALDRALFGI